MAKKWEELENSCYEYLKDWYGDTCKIEAFGKSDSNNADIRVTTEQGNTFFVEVKAASSQCCQFVAFPDSDTTKFVFSKFNKVPFSDNCKKIISYMDASYEHYSKVSTKGLDIGINKAVLYGLADDFYSVKSVKFYMTKSDDFIIFPTDKFSDYFDIKANYRIKGSGSSEPNENRNTQEITHGLSDEQIDGKIVYLTVGGKKRCFLHTSLELNDKRMICPKYTYQFKKNVYSEEVQKQLKNVFEVRRLSNTSNPNVICQLTLKRAEQDKDDLVAFEEALHT